MNNGSSQQIPISFAGQKKKQRNSLPFSGLAQILLDDSLGSPGPASFTAITRYSYSLLGVTLSSTNFVPWKEKKKNSYQYILHLDRLSDRKEEYIYLYYAISAKKRSI